MREVVYARGNFSRVWWNPPKKVQNLPRTYKSYNLKLNNICKRDPLLQTKKSLLLYIKIPNCFENNYTHFCSEAEYWTELE